MFVFQMRPSRPCKSKPCIFPNYCKQVKLKPNFKHQTSFICEFCMVYILRSMYAISTYIFWGWCLWQMWINNTIHGSHQWYPQPAYDKWKNRTSLAYVPRKMPTKTFTKCSLDALCFLSNVHLQRFKRLSVAPITQSKFKKTTGTSIPNILSYAGWFRRIPIQNRCNTGFVGVP